MMQNQVNDADPLMAILSVVFAALCMVIVLAIFDDIDHSAEETYLKAHNCVVVRTVPMSRKFGDMETYTEFRHTALCDGFIRVFKAREKTIP